jgi:hypothetical protein
MKRLPFLKVLALTSSLALTCMFLLFRGGYFDRYIHYPEHGMQTSSNGGAIAKNMGDSISVKPDTLPPESSSLLTPAMAANSLAIQKHLSRQNWHLQAGKYSPVFDSHPKRIDQLEPPIMFSGSKSGRIFSPTHFSPTLNGKLLFNMPKLALPPKKTGNAQRFKIRPNFRTGIFFSHS